MKISLNFLKAMNARYGCTGDIAANGVDALVERIGAQLGAVEEVERLGEKYQGIVVAKVVSCRKHENSDHLNVCLIDDGGITPDVKRDENGLVQVVCGAPNVREGLLVAWLPPGSTVPESVGKDPFVLEARELRGVVSNGMLASTRELALGDNHEGILEINDPFDKIKPGDDFAEAFRLKDDVVLDLENKMFTHRPDCFGFLGVSRELAGIQGMAFKSPDWYTLNPQIPAVEAEVLPLQVQNELPELVPRFCAIAMRDVQAGPSPTWLQAELAKVGVRSINNIVDYTNFFMLQTGQPLHAYDYDKVKALSDGDEAAIVVRNPRPNEQITLLNGKTITPRSEAIMIATDKQLIGIGGVMGGAETEVDETTTNVIIEVASFDMYSIRRTSMAHGLFTDAVTRFNKGQSPLQNKAVLARIVDEIRKFAAGKVASELIDSNSVGDREWVHPPVPLTAAFVNSRLGFDLSAAEMKHLLENVEFKVELSRHSEPNRSGALNSIQGDSESSESIAGEEGPLLTVTAPFWRTDIETREDVVEEVGRLYGFDKLPLQLPQRNVKPTAKNQLLELKSQIRSNLVRAGANEVLTYSFVHGNLLDKVGQDRAQAFKLSNALSPDLQYYRLSLTPSLLEKVHPNIKASYNEFALFELGKVHQQSIADSDDLPAELERLALVYAQDKKLGAAYYEVRAYLMNLLQMFGLAEKVRFVPLRAGEADSAATYYEPGRAATIMVGDQILGRIGEYKSSVRKALKLPVYCAGFELGLVPLQKLQTGQAYVPLSRFPKVTQDITLKASGSLSYQELHQFMEAELAKVQPAETLLTLEPVDIYQREDDSEHKQITLRLNITSYERTLTDTEVNHLLDTVAAAAKEKFNAERI